MNNCVVCLLTLSGNGQQTHCGKSSCGTCSLASYVNYDTSTMCACDYVYVHRYYFLLYND